MFFSSVFHLCFDSFFYRVELFLKEKKKEWLKIKGKSKPPLSDYVKHVDAVTIRTPRRGVENEQAPAKKELDPTDKALVELCNNQANLKRLIIMNRKEKKDPVFDEFKFDVKWIHNYCQPIGDFVSHVVLDVLYQVLNREVQVYRGQPFENLPPKQLAEELFNREGMLLDTYSLIINNFNFVGTNPECFKILCDMMLYSAAMCNLLQGPKSPPKGKDLEFLFNEIGREERDELVHDFLTNVTAAKLRAVVVPNLGKTIPSGKGGASKKGGDSEDDDEDNKVAVKEKCIALEHQSK